MNDQANLKGQEVIYLGGLPRATSRQLLDAAEGRPITPTPEILGNGAIRGTRENFHSAICKVIGEIEMAKICLNSPDANRETDEYYSNALYRQTRLGITLVKTVNALDEPDKKAILQGVARSYSRSSAYTEVLSSLTKAAAQEKA